MKETVQRELTTISHMRDAKAGAMQEIRDRIDTKDKKKVVMDVSFLLFIVLINSIY